MGHLTRTILGNALASTLTTAMTVTVPDSGGQFSVAAATGWPSANFVVVVDRGGLEEKILVSARTGTLCTVGAGGRGFDETSVQAHLIGTAVEPELDAAVVTALLEHVNTDAAKDHGAYLLAALAGRSTDIGTLTLGGVAAAGSSGRYADAAHVHPYPAPASFRAVPAGVSQSPTGGTVIGFAAVDYDNYAGFSIHTATNPDRYTVPAGWAGVWEFDLACSFDSNATGYRDVSLDLNGTIVASCRLPAVTGAPTCVQFSTEISGLVVGDVLRAWATQGSGGALAIAGLVDVVAGASHFGGQWVRG